MGRETKKNPKKKPPCYHFSILLKLLHTMLADTEEVALTFENTNLDSNQTVQTNRIRHPIALVFHLLFRSLAIVVYLFASWIYSSFIVTFVVLIVLLSADFWTCKNITGRLLVGLRWWNNVDENGQSVWVYENRKAANAKDDSSTTSTLPVLESTVETNVFWASLLGTNIVWLTFLVMSFLTFSFKWMVIILVAVMLNASNTYGFLKCKFGTEQSLQSVATSMFGKQMMKSMVEKIYKSSANDNNQTASSSNVNNNNNRPAQQV